MLQWTRRLSMYIHKLFEGRLIRLCYGLPLYIAVGMFLHTYMDTLHLIYKWTTIHMDTLHYYVYMLDTLHILCIHILWILSIQQLSGYSPAHNTLCIYWYFSATLIWVPHVFRLSTHILRLFAISCSFSSPHIESGEECYSVDTGPGCTVLDLLTFSRLLGLDRCVTCRLVQPSSTTCEWRLLQRCSWLRWHGHGIHQTWDYSCLHDFSSAFVIRSEIGDALG